MIIEKGPNLTKDVHAGLSVRSFFQLMKPRHWVNCDAINYFFGCLQELEDNKGRHQPITSRLWFVGTHFMQLAQTLDPKDMKVLQNFGRRVTKDGPVCNILRYSWLVFACHACNSHYFLLMVDMQDMEITCVDSLQNVQDYQNDRNLFYGLLKNYLMTIAKAEGDKRLATNGWNLQIP